MSKALNIIIFCACVFLLAYSAWLCMSIMREQSKSDEYVAHYVSWINAAQEMRHASLLLTREARQYALTLDSKHLQKYLHEVYKNKSREHSLKALCNTSLQEPASAEHLVTALDNSVALADKEQYALRLIAENHGEDLKDFPNLAQIPKLSPADKQLDREVALFRARQMLFDNEYILEQKAILEPIHLFEEANSKTLLEKRQHLTALMEDQSLKLQICLALLFGCVVFFIARLQTRQVHI